jgi:hypothetical protein
MNSVSNFKYEYNNTTNILFKYYYGLITIEDITRSWDFAFENKLIPNEVKGFILDYRDASFMININDRDEIPRFYKKHLEMFSNCKIAILTVNPNDIVIPMLVKEKDDGYKSEAFSTLESAIIWILD